MGLVDLLTDLENFKFGMSSQEQVDEQIESSPPISSDEMKVYANGIVVGSVSKKIESLLGQFLEQNKFLMNRLTSRVDGLALSS